jgi:hypothetical protein
VPGRERPPQALQGRTPATGDAGRRLWTPPAVPGATTGPGAATAPPEVAGRQQPGLAGRQQPGTGPGIISGGLRAGGMPARPGYGGGSAIPDLNAGRLPGGFPQTRGTPPGGAGARSAMDAPAAGGPPGRQPMPGTAAPLYGRDAARGSRSSGGASLMQPSVPRPQISQPAIVRPRPLSMPSTTPVVPRLGTDGF